MKLTFPKTHRTEEMRPLYEEYKSLHPDIIEEWVEIESRSPNIGDDEIPPISEHVQEFLRTRTENDGPTSLLYAFLDFRILLVKEYLGYSLIPENH